MPFHSLLIFSLFFVGFLLGLFNWWINQALRIRFLKEVKHEIYQFVHILSIQINPERLMHFTIWTKLAFERSNPKNTQRNNFSIASGKDELFPLVCHSCEACPRPDRGAGIQADFGILLDSGFRRNDVTPRNFL